MAAAGGIGSGCRVALPACFCALRSSPLTLDPLHSLSPGSWSVDGVTRGAVGIGAGVPLGEVEPGPPRQLWLRRLDRGQARRGRWGCWPGAARLAASGGGGAAGRSPRVFARGWRPLGGAENFRRLQPPSPPASLAASLQAGNALCFFLNFKEEGSPWPTLPFWDWSGCVYWGAGSAGKPVPGRASVFPGGDVSLQNRRPRSLSLPFCRLYTFSYRKAVCENKRRWLT